MERVSVKELAARYQPKPKQASVAQQLSIGEVNKIYESIADLVAEGFRPWYCRAIYRLGPTRVLELADTARKGTVDKRKLMSRLTSDALRARA